MRSAAWTRLGCASSATSPASAVETRASPSMRSVAWTRPGVATSPASAVETRASLNAECCLHEAGVRLQCDEHIECCGNACAAPGSKCCTHRAGYLYPVSHETECEDELCQTRSNTYRIDLACGIYSTCCGDVCVGEGGACCFNESPKAKRQVGGRAPKSRIGGSWPTTSAHPRHALLGLQL